MPSRNSSPMNTMSPCSISLGMGTLKRQVGIFLRVIQRGAMMACRYLIC